MIVFRPAREQTIGMRRKSRDLQQQNDGEPPRRGRLVWRLLRQRPRIFQLNPDPETDKPSTSLTLFGLVTRFLPAWILLLIILLIAPSLPLRAVSVAYDLGRNLTTDDAQSEVVPTPLPTVPLLSPVFTEEVEFWADEIEAWSVEYQIDPNLIATIMQIESCGDPAVSSPAGASGLFQVTGIHFEPGDEHLDPQTNAQAGLTFFAYLMGLSEGDATAALAGYNAGEWAVDASYAALPDETQRYIYWGTGILEEAESGVDNSERLAEWLEAGGTFLCERAAERLGLRVPVLDVQP